MKLLLLTVTILLSLPAQAEQKSYKWKTRCMGGGTYLVGSQLVSTSTYGCRKVMVDNPDGPQSEISKALCAQVERDNQKLRELKVKWRAEGIPADDIKEQECPL